MAKKTSNSRTKRLKKKSRRLSIPSDCKHFTGYRPCFPGRNCLEKCQEPSPHGTRILIVNLEAMGNVLLATTLLKPLKRKYPTSTIYWITLPNALPLLDYNPYIDSVVVWNAENWMRLQAMKFDVVMNLDKSTHTGAFVSSLNAKKKLGYGMNEKGKIIPLNPEAMYNYRLGLDDQLKFRRNQKTSSQLLTEAVGLKYKRDDYILNLSPEELNFCGLYKKEMQIVAPVIVGFNTGCSLLYPNKKMTVGQHLILIDELSRRQELQLILLGGPEDTERNAEIKRRAGQKLISTPTTDGLRKGICYENICDVIISGDSFGMHVGIALRKYVITWFGVSCAQEIDLFGRGVKFIPEDLSCSPCWKKICPYNLECIQMIDLDGIIHAVDSFREDTRRIPTEIKE